MFLEIVRLGIPRLGTWRKQKQGFYQKVIWPPMALRVGLPGSSALQNDGHIKPVILQCRTPRETNPNGHWGPNYFLINSFFFPPWWFWYVLGPAVEGPKTYQDHQGGKKHGFPQKVIWPPMALRIGLPGSSALQNYGLDVLIILQCRTPRETNPKGHWGPNYFFIKSLFLLPPCTQSWYTQSHDL